jgi:hypothetical protein
VLELERITAVETLLGTSGCRPISVTACLPLGNITSLLATRFIQHVRMKRYTRPRSKTSCITSISGVCTASRNSRLVVAVTRAVCIQRVGEHRQGRHDFADRENACFARRVRAGTDFGWTLFREDAPSQKRSCEAYPVPCCSRTSSPNLMSRLGSDRLRHGAYRAHHGCDLGVVRQTWSFQTSYKPRFSACSCNH